MFDNTLQALLAIVLSLTLLLAGCGDSTAPVVANIVLEQTAVVRDQLQLLTHEYAQFRKSQISNPAYHLSLDLQAGSSDFSGTVTITFDLAANNVSPVTVDFDSGNILQVNVNGATAQFDYEHWFLTIPADMFVSGNNTLSISYSRPFATDGNGLHKFTDPENGEEYFYTNLEPYDANRFFPNFDQPNLKAPLTLEVTVPSSWHVIANTQETEIQSEGNRNHWIFPATAPLSSYVYAMHTGPYTVWESNAGGMPLRLFARKAIAPFVVPEEWFIPTQQSFAFYQDYFEVAYPFGKYDQIIVPDFNPGAMENVGAVTFNERYVSRGVKSTAQLRNLASVIAHEMSHMWFGDLVTMDWWNGLWLNESFATYMANLEMERASGFSNVWDSFYSSNKLSAYDADQLITTHPIELAVSSTDEAFTNFDNITYGKGGSVLKQLPYFIGEGNFRVGVSNYLHKYAYQNTTLDNFVDELATASGLNLDQWKHEWLYRSGVNTVQTDFTCANNAITSLRLLQSVPIESTANKDLRSQRTQIGLYHYTDQQMLLSSAIPITYKGAVTYVSEAIGMPCPDLVNPNEDDWAYMRIKLDATSITTVGEHINDFTSPTTRIMLWQSLWDLVEAGELPLTEYLPFVLNNIGSENDDNVVRHVNGTLAVTFGYFSRFGDFAEEKIEIENFLFNQLRAAKPGSELQKIWYDSFVSRAHTAKALDYLLELLNENTLIDGLVMDQDKRWNLVIALNRYQHGPFIELLSTESTRDPSDQGKNMALAAAAIRPDPAVKEQWLDTIINSPDTYKLATLRSVMAVLFPDEQLELLTPYTDLLLTTLEILNTTATQQFLGEYTSYFDAATCTPASVARLAKANIKFANYQPSIVKAYQVHQQRDERCVKLKTQLP